MAYYRRHVFVCINERADGEQCCARGGKIGGEAAVKFLRRALKAEAAHGKGKTRVNKAGCLDRCRDGPSLLVYPEGVWYRYADESDLAEIARAHLQGGEIVARLALPD